MSKFTSPHLGKITQSSGGVTFTNWKGINVMKAKATSVANPKSQGQQENRTKFSNIVRYARQILNGLNITLKSFAIKKSQYNVFVGGNVDKIDSTTGLYQVSFNDTIVLSRGTLEGLISPSTGFMSPTQMQITWNPTGYNVNTSSKDLVATYFYNANKDEFAFAQTNSERASGNGLANRPANWTAGDTVSVWICAYNSQNNASNNQYIGDVVLT